MQRINRKYRKQKSCRLYRKENIIIDKKKVTRIIAQNKKPIDIYNQVASSESTLKDFEQIQILSLRENRVLINALLAMEDTDEI